MTTGSNLAVQRGMWSELAQKSRDTCGTTARATNCQRRFFFGSAAPAHGFTAPSARTARSTRIRCPRAVTGGPGYRAAGCGHRNDLNDITALGTAAAYCDV